MSKKKKDTLPVINTSFNNNSMYNKPSSDMQIESSYSVCITNNYQAFDAHLQSKLL